MWLALLVLPVALAGAFSPFIGYLAFADGLRGDALVTALEAVAPIPATAAFAIGFWVIRSLARKDGLALAALGWIRPSAADLGIGLTAALGLSVLNARVLYPLVEAAQPSFDPTLAAVSLPVGVVMLSVAAVAEDTLYRGYALRVLRERHGTIVAVLVTTLAYALLAPGSELPLKLWAAYFGAVLCLLRLWRRNLWPVVITHVLVALSPKLLATLD